jgi:cephalosporin hydroxylase
VSGPGLPHRVDVKLSEPVGDLWLRRIWQLLHDTYMDVPLRKLPEDLRVYEHLLFRSRCSVVIELGTDMGGSALWFRDRLRTLGAYGRTERPERPRPHVISVDQSTAEAIKNLDSADPSWRESISLIEGDVCDPALPDRVRSLVPDGARCLVSEDTAHTYETTRAALDGFSEFVAIGSFFVVEDGFVDVEQMRLAENWPRGVLPAIREWLAEQPSFRVRRDVELYGLSCNPEGYLERVR